MKNHYFTIALTLLLTSCVSDVMDKQYSYETFEEDIIEIRKQVTMEQADLLERAIRLAYKEKLNITDGPDSAIMTYRSLLHLLEESQKGYLSKQEEKEAAERVKREKMLNSVIIGPLSKRVRKANFYRGEYRHYFEFECEVYNVGPYDIKAVRGTMIFYDVFDNIIMQVETEFTKPIPKSGGKINMKVNWDYYEFRPEDKKFENVGITDMSVAFWTSQMVLSDGTKIER